MSKNPGIVAESWAWAKAFGAGLPVTAQGTLAAAYQRVGGKVSADAYMLPALTSRTLTLSAAGGAQQTTLQLGTALLITSVSCRIYLDDTNDDTTMVTLRFSLPNVQGFLVGDPNNDFNAALLAENGTWLPLLTPWMILPIDQAVFTATPSAAMAGNATVVLGLQGNWVYGLT